jgi:glycosyltransferase involved in cell wall biosynthesis
MTFCMVSTFYPPYHFGGDATYLARLVDALARRGHEVDVIHDRDAYHLAHPGEPEGPAPSAANGVRVHTLSSRARRLSPLITHQTGRPKAAVRTLLERGAYDVVHFHNASLIGARAFAYGNALKLYTTHEHWLVCPLSLLWKFDREVCTRRACVSCMVRAKRPPQWWRYTGLLERALPHIDTFISPSRFTRDTHRQWGLDLPFEVLPYFVPQPAGDVAAERPWPRPYFLFAGRLVHIKGLQTILPIMQAYPDADLLVAGDGPDAPALRALAGDSPRIHFLGAQPYDRLRALYRDAIALIMPSICYEVFGIVLLEAFVERTPVIVRRLGGMPEAVEDSGGGLTYETDAELIDAMRRLQQDRPFRDALGAAGHAAYRRLWSDEPHLDGYFDIISRARERRRRRA